LPRLVFSGIIVPHQGSAKQAGEVALRMVEAGVDAANSLFHRTTLNVPSRSRGFVQADPVSFAALANYDRPAQLLATE
jgi:hypothetical protein